MSGRRNELPGRPIPANSIWSGGRGRARGALSPWRRRLRIAAAVALILHGLALVVVADVVGGRMLSNLSLLALFCGWFGCALFRSAR